MSETRNWREAKPKWVVDAAEEEMAAMKRKLALRWPDETRPTPLPFGFGDYDKAFGKCVPGTYWVVEYNVSKVELRKKLEGELGWKSWRFSVNDRGFTDNVSRGTYYATEREARLEYLWRRCDEAAKELGVAWDVFAKSEGGDA